MKEHKMYKRNINETVERRKAFHNGDMKDRILLSIVGLKQYPYPDRSSSMHSSFVKMPPTGQVVADVPDINTLANGISGWFSQMESVEDDSFPLFEIMNYFGHAVACEILGHPVKRIAMGNHTGSVNDVLLDNIEQAMELQYNEDTPHVRKITDYLKAAKTIADGKWIVSPYVLADGLHCLTLLFGYNKAYMMLYDDPDGVHRFSEKMLDINIKFFDLQYDIAGSVAGGYTCTRSDWNPTRCIDINLDDYLCCSNEVLQEFGLPYIQKAIDHFGCGIIHYHTPDTRLLREVVKLKNIKIQVGSDPKLREPLDCIYDIKQITQEIPLTWMRINRSRFLQLIKDDELPGNTEYLLSGAFDTHDANELCKIAKDYVKL